MTVDALPILAYKVSEAQFDLCSDQSFISIRDQAVRVRTLLTAMLEGGLLNNLGDSKVLVVGAGYAGVSAALWLSDNGIETWLIDQEDAAFAVQRKCSTRYLSLTQYDWPALHHSVHSYPGDLPPNFIWYPWLKPSLPFMGWKGQPIQMQAPRNDLLYTWEVKAAKAHVADWDQQFDAVAGRSKTLNWKPKTKFLPGSISVAQGRVGVDLKSLITGAVSRESFAYVFFATGFGSDSAKIAMRDGAWHQTKGFWTDDDLAVPSQSPPKRILISGGGDGAVQDFVRALVNPAYPTAISVMNAVRDHIFASMGGPPPMFEAAWAQVESMIEYAESQAGHAVAWSGEKRDDVWKELQRRYDRALEQFCVTYSGELIAALAHILDRPLAAKEITLVYKTEVLQKVYPLNRLVFTLFKEYFVYVDRGGQSFFGASPARIRPLGGGGLPRVRMLPLHELDIQHSIYDPSIMEFSAPVHHVRPGGGKSINLDVDELLVRHGVPKFHPVIRAGLHEFGMELGRIKLPFASVA